MPEGFAVNPEVLQGERGDFAVSPGAVQRGRYGTASATPGDPPKPESPLRNAQLMPADPNKGYATPYYAAYTNDGDFAGAVMVAPGQKIRLVDKMTGDVVFEGAGPEAAQTATAVANSISQNQGRTAAWAIQKPTDEGGWVSMAEERWDPKKQSLLGKVADFALPIIGAILAPGIGLAWAAVGSAAGSALSSVAQGRSFEETVKRAALSAGLTYVGGTAVGKLGKVLANSESPIGQAMYNGYSAVMKPLNAVTRAVDGAGNVVTDTLGKAATGAGNTVREVIVQGVKGGVDAVTGGALSAVGGSAVTGAGGQNVMRGGTGADTVGNTIEGVDVTASTDPLTGAGVGALTSVTAAPKTAEPSVSEVVVEGGGNDSLPGGALSTVTTTPATDVSEVVVEPSEDSLPGTDTFSGTDDGETSSDPGDDSLDDSKKPAGMSWADWLKLLSLVSGGVTTATQGSGPASLPAGVLDAGTPGSLPDIFRAKLPPPSGPFADMSARNVSMTPEEWATYGQRGQVAFLNSTPQRPSGILPSPTGFAANVTPTPDVQVAGGYWPEPTNDSPPVPNFTPRVGGGPGGYTVMIGDTGATFNTREEADKYASDYAVQSANSRAAIKAQNDAWAQTSAVLDKADPSKVVSHGGKFYAKTGEAGNGVFWRDYATEADAQAAVNERLARTAPQSPTAPTSPFAVSGVPAASTLPGAGPTFTGPTPYEAGVYNQAPTNPTPFRDVVARPLPMPAPSANPEDFARGGFAVRGMGSGRDDKIPARLSDGEYVIDAETVALLGDGSTKAGADRLDQFRVNIRKHKGRKLAKGAFSANAKPPEAYLRGGRT
ncbi:MAG: hypothetical protein RI988_3504 [Pseudomonadota bacterium]|jgi:hypothetical protein